MVESHAARGCPKCGAARAGESACPKCGLLASRMAAFEKDREESVPALVRAAWEKVAGDWEDPANHDALLALTTEHRVFAWTAARYREAGAPPPSLTEPYRDPGKGRPGAAAYLERIRKGAEVTMMVTATANRAERRQPYLSSFVVLALVGFMIFVGLILARYMRERGPREEMPKVNSAGSPAAGPSEVR